MFLGWGLFIRDALRQRFRLSLGGCVDVGDAGHHRFASFVIAAGAVEGMGA